MHTVILGNGIVALSTAFRVVQRWTTGSADRLTIVGHHSRPGSATLAAAAMFNSFAEVEAGSLDHPIDLYRFELSHLATQMWPDFERALIHAAGDALPASCHGCEGFNRGGCITTGTYVVNNNAADDLDDENFDAIVRALQDFNEPHDLVAPRDIPNYSPEQRQRATRAVFIPGEGWANPRLMLEKLDAILRRDPRVRFMDTAVERLERSANGAEIGVAVLTDGARVQGDQYLLATGASVTDVLARSALGLPVQRIFYGVGVSLELDSPEHPHTHCIRTPNRGLACGVYTVPYYTGSCASDGSISQSRILLGASNFTSPTPVAHGRVGSVEALLKAGMEQINRNFYRASLVRVNVGWRPTSQDTYPLLGRTSLSNLVIATGTKRDGFHLAPLISQYMAALLHGEAVDERFACFAPERPPLRLLTRAQAVSKAVRHQLSASYQHGFSPAKSRMPEQIAQMLRDQVERLHDEVGAVDWGIPPEMLDMYRYGHARA